MWCKEYDIALLDEENNYNVLYGQTKVIEIAFFIFDYL